MKTIENSALLNLTVPDGRVHAYCSRQLFNAQAFSIFFFLLLLPFWSIGLISQFRDHCTEGRTPWTGDQLVEKPLPKHRQYKHRKTRAHTHTPNIHALSGIRTLDPGFRASEDSTCPRPLGYCDRPFSIYKKLTTF
jgi:hypothetical protein